MRPHGREPGEIILQAGSTWAADEAARRSPRRGKWKATQLAELYTDDLHDPAEMLRRADEQMSDEQFAKEGFIVGADPEEHVERIREMESSGRPSSACSSSARPTRWGRSARTASGSSALRGVRA